MTMRTDELEYLRSVDFIDWKRFDGKTVYITGATGLIGSNLVDAILNCSNAKLIVQIRDLEKAQKLFGTSVEYVLCDLNDKSDYSGKVDYVIHCANPTSSRFFVNNPVETISTAVSGTLNALKFANEKKVKGFVFLSTMEVYGMPEKGHKVSENEGGMFDTAIVRNCYPISKQTCESLCVAYATEYGVHTRVVRLTQTFGPGVSYNDGRVFAEFARCAIEKRNIVLKTEGKTERDYLYTVDAVSAILTVLLGGGDGEIYTAANESTYCSIKQMAELVAQNYKVGVRYELQDTKEFGYAPTLYMNLDVSKLKSIGWKPQYGLLEMYIRMIEDMKKQ